MSYAYTWPLSLPQAPLMSSYSEATGPCIISTEMSQGPAKLRRLSPLTDPIPVKMNLSSTQLATLNTFVSQTLKGVARFGWTHPRLKTIVEFRFVPGDGNRLISIIQKLGPDFYLVGFNLEVMP